jgi:hypothetical protein
MATMHLKNKYEVSFRELINETEKKKGIPKEITVEPMEAWGILNEIRSASSPSFDIKVLKEHDSFSLYSRLRRGDDHTADEANELIRMWHNGDFAVYFDNIPLRVVPAASKPKPVEEQPRKKWFSRK